MSESSSLATHATRILFITFAHVTCIVNIYVCSTVRALPDTLALLTNDLNASLAESCSGVFSSAARHAHRWFPDMLLKHVQSEGLKINSEAPILRLPGDMGFDRTYAISLGVDKIIKRRIRQRRDIDKIDMEHIWLLMFPASSPRFDMGDLRLCLDNV